MSITYERPLSIMVDIQERLVPVMHDPDRLISTASALAHGLNLLKIPMVLSEQYPKGLGQTASVFSDIPWTHQIEKNTFSCFGQPKLQETIDQYCPSALILFGIESHICLYQTAQDALQKKIPTVIIEDSCQSRKLSDHSRAMQNLQLQGAELLSTEMLLFMLMHSSKHPKFREISGLIKGLK